MLISCNSLPIVFALLFRRALLIRVMYCLDWHPVSRLIPFLISSLLFFHRRTAVVLINRRPRSPSIVRLYVNAITLHQSLGIPISHPVLVLYLDP